MRIAEKDEKGRRKNKIPLLTAANIRLLLWKTFFQLSRGQWEERDPGSSAI